MKKYKQLAPNKAMVHFKFGSHRKMLGLVHTSYFCRVEFNSVNCGGNAATVDSDVAVVSN